MHREIQKHLDEIKLVFLSKEYDDDTMGWIVEDHIYAIEEILAVIEKEQQECEKTQSS